MLLGRSRSAEYGRVRIEKADRAETVQHGASDGKTLALWLLSDLALADRHGRPTLDPDPETLDLDGRIDWGHTFLRTRRYAPWNAYRHGYDRERLLLCAGGVISFTLNTPPGAHTLARLEAGIGLFREAGLGRVWIEPPLLAGKTHRLTRHKEPPRSHAPAPQHPLLAWLTERAADWRAPLDEHAKDLAGQIKDRLRAGRRRHGIGDAEDFGPSKSQWGRVLDTARAQSGKALHATLFAGDSAVIKPDGDGWSEIIDYHRDKPVRIASWLQEKLAPGPHRDNHYAYLIRRLAHLMRGDTARKGSKKGEPDNG